MMKQVKRKIKDEFKKGYGDDFLYYAARFAVVTSGRPEDDYFAAAASTQPDLPIWRLNGTDNRNKISNDKYHAWNNTAYIANVRAGRFLVGNNNDPAPEIIPGVISITVKDKRMPLDQDWGLENTFN